MLEFTYLFRDKIKQKRATEREKDKKKKLKEKEKQVKIETILSDAKKKFDKPRDKFKEEAQKEFEDFSQK